MTQSPLSDGSFWCGEPERRSRAAATPAPAGTFWPSSVTVAFVRVVGRPPCLPPGAITGRRLAARAKPRQSRTRYGHCLVAPRTVIEPELRAISLVGGLDLCQRQCA